MATNKKLLQHTGKGAVIHMLNDENHTLFDGSHTSPLSLSPPLSVGTDKVRTEVEMTIRRALSSADQIPYAGTLVFRYNRLDVNRTLKGILSGFRPSLPSSTQALLNEITKRVGITFEESDFFLEDIIRSNASPATIRARPESLRWVGEVQVDLVNLTDLGMYLPGSLPGDPPNLSFTPPSFTNDQARPYLNASSQKAVIDKLAVGTTVYTSTDALAQLIRTTVPGNNVFLMDANLSGFTTQWMALDTPYAYNLKGAKVVSKLDSVADLNPLLPELTKAIVVEFGPLTTGLTNRRLTIPYQKPTPSLTFSDSAKFRQSGLVTNSDATAWFNWVSTIHAPSILTEIPADIIFAPSGPDQWVCDPSTPGPTNLYNAVVQYNGVRRAVDGLPFNKACDRIIVLTVSDHNTAYQGNVAFHYRDPSVVVPPDPEDTWPANDGPIYLGSYEWTYHYNNGYGTTLANYPLYPFTTPATTQDYVVRVERGELPAGVSVEYGNVLYGQVTREAALQGEHMVALEIRGSQGIKGFVTFTINVLPNPITIVGNESRIELTSANPVGSVYVGGGFMEYTYQWIHRSGPDDLIITTQPDGVTSSAEMDGYGNRKFSFNYPMGGEVGVRAYDLEITDATGEVATFPIVANVNVPEKRIKYPWTDQTFYYGDLYYDVIYPYADPATPGETFTSRFVSGAPEGLSLIYGTTIVGTPLAPDVRKGVHEVIIETTSSLGYSEQETLIFRAVARPLIVDGAQNTIVLPFNEQRETSFYASGGGMEYLFQWIHRSGPDDIAVSLPINGKTDPWYRDSSSRRIISVVNTPNTVVGERKYDLVLQDVLDQTITTPVTFNIESPPPSIKLLGAEVPLNMEGKYRSMASIYVEGGTPEYIYQWTYQGGPDDDVFIVDPSDGSTTPVGADGQGRRKLTFMSSGGIATGKRYYNLELTDGLGVKGYFTVVFNVI